MLSFSAMMTTSTWVLIAVSPEGKMDRFFLTTASYGDSKALLGITRSLQMYDTIPLVTSPPDDFYLGKDRFPGITAVNSTVYAFGETGTFFGLYAEKRWSL
jgi:hypothetical protein